ncbi:FmdB family zinc ribbon protein [Desulforhabdus amnigena]|uniref:FmdB family zinc ribbon protein n=1 Tax=Desulforhabdus amnigena TaxID=40218 RepID=UPI0016AEE429|nr:zinc ribbon domain-containing protein [Deltaproteobacteria bacterium]
MPIYEYRCKSCQNDFEILIISSDDQQNATCPKCKSREVERILSCFCKSSAITDGAGSSCNAGSGGFS